MAIFMERKGYIVLFYIRLYLFCWEYKIRTGYLIWSVRIQFTFIFSNILKMYDLFLHYLLKISTYSLSTMSFLNTFSALPHGDF